MKKILRFLMGMFLIFSLCSCSNQGKSNEEIVDSYIGLNITITDTID